MFGTGVGYGYGCWVRVLGAGVGYGYGCWVLLGTVTGIGIGYRCWVRVRVLGKCLGAGTVPIVPCPCTVPPYPCTAQIYRPTVPIVPTIRTQLATDLASDFLISLKLINIYFLINKIKSVARSVANWVRIVGTVGTVHGYGTHRTHHCTQVATDLATNFF